MPKKQPTVLPPCVVYLAVESQQVMILPIHAIPDNPHTQTLRDEHVGFFPMIENQRLKEVRFAFFAFQTTPFWTATKTASGQYQFSGRHAAYLNPTVVLNALALIETQLADAHYIQAPLTPTVQDANDLPTKVTTIQQPLVAETREARQHATRIPQNILIIHFNPIPGILESNTAHMDDFGLLQGGPIDFEALVAPCRLSLKGILKNNRFITGTTLYESHTGILTMEGSHMSNTFTGTIIRELSDKKERWCYEGGPFPASSDGMIDLTCTKSTRLTLRKFTLPENRLFCEYKGFFKNGVPHGQGELSVCRLGNIKTLSGSFVNGDFQNDGKIHLTIPDSNTQATLTITTFNKDGYVGKMTEEQADNNGNEMYQATSEGLYDFTSCMLIKGKKVSRSAIQPGETTIETGTFDAAQSLHSSSPSVLCTQEIFRNNQLVHSAHGTFVHGAGSVMTCKKFESDGTVIRTHGKWGSCEEGVLLHDPNGLSVIKNKNGTSFSWNKNIQHGARIEPFLYTVFLDEATRHVDLVIKIPRQQSQEKPFFWCIKKQANGEYEISFINHDQVATELEASSIIAKFCEIEQDLIAAQDARPFQLSDDVQREMLVAMVEEEQQDKQQRAQQKKQALKDKKETEKQRQRKNQEKGLEKRQKIEAALLQEQHEQQERKAIAEQNRLARLKRLAEQRDEHLESLYQQSQAQTVHHDTYTVPDVRDPRYVHHVEKWFHRNSNGSCHVVVKDHNVGASSSAAFEDLYVIYTVHAQQILQTGNTFSGWAQVDVFSTQALVLQERFIYDGQFMCTKAVTEPLTDELNFELQNGQWEARYYTDHATEIITETYQNGMEQDDRSVRTEETPAPLSTDEVRQLTNNPYTFYARTARSPLTAPIPAKLQL